MDFPNFIQLYHTKEVLTGAKEAILNEWISQKQCASILDRHSIDPKWFKEYYASAVFDYFMGVVAGNVELGQCPVMKEFIDYLKNQEIRSDELFILCSNFKRSVVNVTYMLEINSQGLFEAISYLFDMNFAGVLTLYTDTIYQKEQEAIEANKAKEYFLSNISHEIRTPLNAILGFVNLLQGENLGERIEKYLDIIAQSGENLLHIINDILDFSKLRSGEFAIDPHPFNIHNEITNTLELFIPSANVKSISIVYSINPQIPHCIHADSFRIQQILGNLLSNAIKFSPPDCSIDVSIDVNRTDSVLLIRVRDYGMGIDLADQERIFDPFYQASEGMKFGGGGSGLGLSICKQLAIQMGGEITLESKIDWGSLFVVTLAVEFPPAEICEVKAVSSSTVSFVGKVLVAEDNEANQALIRITLERYGLEVSIVSNGQKAFESACDNQYDLIFMDEQMPIMNGHEAVSKIRQYETEHHLSSTPIIELSANVFKGSREKALQWGYDAFVGKPFSGSDIENLLEKYLEKGDVSSSDLVHEKVLTEEMQRLEKVLMLSPQQIGQLLDLFHKNMSTLLVELKENIEQRKYKEIARIAHTIKGSSANFRFEEFSLHAARLEDHALHDRALFDFDEAYRMLEYKYKKLYSSR
ncbi:MAG: ATP-binding protein [Sulfuricurvum sp.]|nr:ATP-binding protein [Sulfuricurvum sp.]MDD5385631.1 ATP-binding protein [Sulfuricurvum sp.]